MKTRLTYKKVPGLKLNVYMHKTNKGKPVYAMPKIYEN